VNLPAIDERRRVRLWDKDYNCIADERIADDRKPIDLIRELMGDAAEARATVDHPSPPWNAERWSGYIYRDESGELRVWDHRERLRTWPIVD
jgi:hypothetical protein